MDRRFVVAADFVVPVDGPILQPGHVAVDGGRIAAVGDGPPPRDAGPIEDLGRAAILPGFVNAHAHLGCAFLHGIADDSDFLDWILGDVAPRVIAAVRDSADVIAAEALDAARELATGGVTCVADSFLHAAGRTALKAVGLRGRFHREVFGARAKDLEDYVETTLQELREEAVAHPSADLVGFGVAPHSLYTCPRDVLVAVDALCRDLGLRQTIHVDESAEEHRFFAASSGTMHAHFTSDGGADRYRLGETPVGVLSSLGMLRPDVLLVHAVQVTAEDVAAIAAAGAHVVHCPTSNHRLAVGVAPVAEMLAAGIDVALGTDSHGSSGKLDMFEEMRLAILAQRAASRSAAALDAPKALEMATLAGARALGLEETIGSLVPGKAADLTAVDLSGVRQRRLSDPVSAVVWSSTPDDVIATWVEGRAVHRRGAS